MAKLIKYAYETENVSNKGEIENKIRTLQGVVKCAFEGDFFTYVLDSSADEYDILVQSMNLCEEFGGELFVAENNVVPLNKTFNISENLSENAQDESLELTIEEDAKNDDNEHIGALFDENGEENDEENADFDEKESDKPNLKKAVPQELKKQDISSQMIVGIVELSLATVLFVISLFLPRNFESVFSGRTILSIFAFAIAGYEIFYQAIGDIVKKKFFTENVVILFISILSALLNSITEICAILIIISAAKQVELYFENKLKFNLNERFSTGQSEFTTNDGEFIEVENLSEGDELTLSKYDFVPCDSEALSNGVVDSYYLTGEFEQKLSEKSEVLAGSVVLSDSLKIKVQKTNALSQIVLKKKAFEDKVKDVAKPSKVALYVNLTLFFLAIVYAFVMPIFGGADYMNLLYLTGQRAIGLISGSLIIYQFLLASKCKKFAIVSARLNEIDFENEELFSSFGLANSFEFSALQLTEKGELKEDSIGALKELLSLGVKNVTTDFNGAPLNEEVKKQIDFVDKAFKGENKFYCQNNLVLGEEEGKISIINEEISFVPLAYRIAKKAKKREKTIKILSIIFAILLTPMAILIPVNVLSPVYVGAIGSFISLISAILLSTTIPKAN